MIAFIVFLRALAACIITNAHYVGVYPNDIIASGGLIGDVLFFAVSGYCLYNIKYPLGFKGFIRWYGRRVWRIFPPVVIITAVYMLVGFYKLGHYDLVWWYLYPTAYHFVVSILLLYIPYFFIINIEALKSRLPLVMLAVFAAYLILYFTVYDKSAYHIDNVREPMIRFIYFESMLLGAWFRRNDEKYRGRFSPILPIAALLFAGAYFALKMLFTKRPEAGSFQFAGQLAVFAVLFFTFRTFMGLDGRLSRAPKWVMKPVSFIAGAALEIYVVQSQLIIWINRFGIPFPLNWLVITAAILLAGFLLHAVCGLLYRLTDRLLKRDGKTSA